MCPSFGQMLFSWFKPFAKVNENKTSLAKGLIIFRNSPLDREGVFNYITDLTSDGAKLKRLPHA